MGYLLMRPDEDTNKIIAGVVVHVKQRYGENVKIHNGVFMSNHYHLLITPFDQRVLANFMRDVNSCLAKELGLIHDVHGHLWHTKYKASPVLDECELERRYRYIFANSVKEGLVEHPRDWPGIHAYRAICEAEQIEGVWIDRTRLYQARQRAKLKCNKDKPKPTEADFSEPLTLTFDGPPPLWGDLSDEEYLALCQRLTDEVVQHYAEERAEQGERVMGAEAVKAQPVMEKRFVKRSMTPLYHAQCMERAREYREAYWAFVAHFKEASQALRRHVARTCCTLEVMFPEGGIPLAGGG
jgi:REP element-mobilizing transposase RayT